MDAVIEGFRSTSATKTDDGRGHVLSLFPIMLSHGAGDGTDEADRDAHHWGHGEFGAIYVLFLIPCLFAIGEDIARLRKRKLAE